MWIQMPMKPCVHLHPWQRPSTTPFAVWLLVWGCARFIIEYFCIALCPNSMCTCNNEKMNLLNSSFFCRGIRSTQNCGFPAMPSARSLTSTRLSKLQACALLCLGVPPLVLLACIYVWNRLRIKAMILHGKYSHLICLLWRPEFSSFGLGWFSMGSIHIWFVYCGDLSLHLSDLVAETIDRDATRDWAFGAYVFETNLQRFFCIHCSRFANKQNLFDSYWTKIYQLIYIIFPSVLPAGSVLHGVLQWMWKYCKRISLLGSNAWHISC